MPNETSTSTYTYFVDPEERAEAARLMHQDRLVTQAMGEPLPERTDIGKMQTILDVACGPGGWALEVAHRFPHLQVVGVDISQTTINYATMHARVQGLGNASFRTMDVLGPLDFPDHAFDLVNARLLVAFLPRTHWPTFIKECVRVLRPGGILRLTEGEFNFTTSPVLNTLEGHMMQALKKAGQGFSLDGSQCNITPMLVRLLRNAGCQHIGRRAHVIDFSAGEEPHDSFLENLVAASQLAQPFLIRMGGATQEELDGLQQALLEEMSAKDFNALWFLLTVWGTTPESS
jgi:ubiquinone/menaquinone biosynthesis C-methylase UbiE